MGESHHLKRIEVYKNVERAVMLFVGNSVYVKV